MVIKQDLRKYPVLSHLGLKVGGTLTEAIRFAYPDLKQRKEVKEKLAAAIIKLYPEVAKECEVDGNIWLPKFEKHCKKNRAMLYEVAVEAGV